MNDMMSNGPAPLMYGNSNKYLSYRTIQFGGMGSTFSSTNYMPIYLVRSHCGYLKSAPGWSN
jgi:hypothetical protein